MNCVLVARTRTVLASPLPYSLAESGCVVSGREKVFRFSYAFFTICVGGNEFRSKHTHTKNGLNSTVLRVDCICMQTILMIVTDTLISRSASMWFHFKQITNHKNALLLASDALTTLESSASPPFIACKRVPIESTASSEESTSPPLKTATILRNKKPTPSSTSGDGSSNITNNNKRHSRSQLAQHRKSLSESDLLHEIDDALVFSRGFLLARGRLRFFLSFSFAKQIITRVCECEFEHAACTKQQQQW